MSYLSKTLSNIKQELLSHQLENFKATQIEDEAESQKALANRANIMDSWLFGVDTQISNILHELRRQEQEEKTSILSNPKRIVGMVDFTSDQVVVSDPCYELGTWCQHVLTNVKPGKWMATKELSHEGEWGIRVASLEAYIGSEPQESDYELVEEADIGVDSGQAGFFDLSGYRNTFLLNNNSDPASLCHPMFMPDDPSSEDYDAELFYGVCCNLTLNGRDAGILPGGTVSTTGYGDGAYPLLVRKDEDGLITAMKIVYLGPDEDEEEDDEADTEAMHNDEE